MTTERFPLLNYARWATLTVVFLTPWPYACIPTWTHPWLYGIQLGITALWGVGLAVRRQRPTIPRAVIFCGAWLLLHGWLLIINAQYSYDWEKYAFVPAHPWLAGKWIPGALDIAVALPAMLRVTGFLAMLWILVNMASEVLWRRRILATMLFSGVALVVYGLLQRMLHLPLLLWKEWDLDHNLFASFYYHGNAGAFVNLLIPPLVGYTALAFGKREAHTRRAVMLVSLILSLAAMVAIASKAAMLVTLVILPASGWLAFRYAMERKMIRTRKTVIQIAAGAGVALLGVILFGLDRSAERWTEAAKLLHGDNPRPAAWQACLRMLGDAGPWGIGPGNFPLAFPHYTAGLPATMGVWEHAHQDYLEICIEWGWCGFVVWMALLGGALWRGLRRQEPSKFMTGSDLLLTRLVGISLVGVLLHALVDFPLQIPAIQVFVATLLAILWNGSPLPSHVAETLQAKAENENGLTREGQAV